VTDTFNDNFSPGDGLAAADFGDASFDFDALEVLFAAGEE